MSRRLLPAKRRCETFTLPFGGLSRNHSVTIGYYEDDMPGEVFITGGKSGEMVEAIARDSAILLSFCLQHGVPLDAIRHAITRDAQNTPLSIVGVVVDKLVVDDTGGQST